MRTRLASSWLALLITASFAPGCTCGGDENLPPPDASPSDAQPAPDGVVMATDGAAVDAPPTMTMSVTDIIPAACSRLVETQLTILGHLLAPGATVTLSSCDSATTYEVDVTAIADDGQSLTAMLAADPTREQGLYTVTVANPDGMSDLLACALRILPQAPPTVSAVVPATAWNGVPGDGRSSDTLVTLTGTGFESTPAVRWVKTDGSVSFLAATVGFVSDSQITAVVPSESLKMTAGEYNVYVANPSLLGAEWLVPDASGAPVPGVFTVTAAPPPAIADIQPPRIENGTCTTSTLAITGTGFGLDATVYYAAPDGTICDASMVDESGRTLCRMDATIEDEGTIAAHFSACPGQGPWPIVVVNADGQKDYFFSVEVTPSSEGHLNQGAFEAVKASLVTPRWKHGAGYGFDAFGHVFLYAVGGQDAAGAALGTVELSELSIFGVPGPFAVAMQWLDATTPRAANTLAEPRVGGTLVRAGRDLFFLGGATSATDVAAAVPAVATVERAHLLSYDEMPGVHLPHVMPGAGLPAGAWYYQVTALGAWGESLGSREVLARMDGGVVELCWDPPATGGATGYNVYRSLAADGRSGTAVLLAGNVAGPCFTDAGTAELSPAPGNIRGNVADGAGFAAGRQSYRVSAIVAGDAETIASYPVTVELLQTDIDAGKAALELTWDAVAGATGYRLFRLDAATGEYLLVDTDGTPDGVADPLAETSFVDAAAPVASVLAIEGIRPLPPGSLSTWQIVSPAMNTPREGLDGVVVTLDPDTSAGLAARILVVGGRTSNQGGYLTTAESLGVAADGTLDPAWTDETSQLVHPRAYYALLTTQDRDTTVYAPPPEEPPCGDLDGDGFIDCACAPLGATDVDCNDLDAGIHPGATEVCSDGIDQDCDAGCGGSDLACACDTDLDGDGHIAMLACTGDDCCDDGTEGGLGCSVATAAGVHVGAVEICGDGIDQTCDGVDPPCACNTDADGDGHLALACGGDDCCDSGADRSLGCTDVTAAGVHPDAAEICNNGIDDDCDGGELLCRRIDGAGSSAPTGSVTYDVVSTEPVYVVAVLGDTSYQASGNEGSQDMEACEVDSVTGHLACGASFVVQPDTVPASGRTFGMDALLYFGYLFPFYGVNEETVATSPSTRTFVSSSISRFPVNDPTTVTDGELLGSRQSASTSFALKRTHYQMVRLMSYVFAIGGWAEEHTLGDGTVVPEGPTGSLERHEQ